MSALNLHELEFSALANHFYHDRAQKLYNCLGGIVDFFQITLPTGAVIAMLVLMLTSFGLSPELLTLCIAGILACLNGFEKSAHLPDKKFRHQALNEAWMELLEEVRESQEVDLERLNRRFHQLNRKEPPCNDKRLNWAYEKACIAMGLEPVGGRSGGNA